MFYPDLSFFYWTGHRHDDEPLPSFNDPSGTTERLGKAVPDDMALVQKEIAAFETLCRTPCRH
ncbi:hypothetical protein OS493_036993 [Desmophyllum pertusum]|uniref:Uncharacterized protein n=1 Tax=Desmophyllum pertusum TaxID=174260 RepID=A0A9W9YUQ9_9CNID|nr:hypothetical protein OS493_036993 [Desmophyllum pertusum]